MQHRLTRRLAAGALLLAATPPALAGQEVTITDERGLRQGTPSLPFFVTVTNPSSGGGTGSTANAASTSNATDGQATSASNQQSVVFPYLFNGSSWDRARGTGGFLGVMLQAPLPAGTNVVGAVTQSGAWTVGLSAGTAAIGSVTVSNLPSTQAVSNGGTFAVQNTAAVVGGNSAAVKVDGSAVTQPVSNASLPLPANAAQETGGNLATIATRTPPLGAAVKASSQPVTMATDQPPIQTTPNSCALTQTSVTLAANTSAQLVAAAPYKTLKFQNTGTNPMTVSAGTAAATVGGGMNYNAAAGTGQGGGSETFAGGAVPSTAFQAISAAGTTATVWACQ